MSVREKATLPGLERFLPESAPPHARTFADLTAGEVARLYAVTPQAVDKWIAAGCPCARPPAGRRRFDLALVIPWRRERDRAHSPTAPDDPDLVVPAGQSEALERYRLAKAKQAELDLAIALRLHIPRADVCRDHRRIAAALRAALESVGRRHGTAVAAEIADAIDHTIAQLDQVAPAPDDHEDPVVNDPKAQGGATPDPPPATQPQTAGHVDPGQPENVENAS